MKSKKITAATKIAFPALFSVIIVLCSWLSIPAAVPFTMQTFAVFFTLLMLGGASGTVSVLVYILLGAVGLPVFHGFTGGIGVLFGATGGYILGFLLTGIIYWLATKLFGNGLLVRTAALVVGLLACYAVGTAWFMLVYTKSTGTIGLAGALGMCVVPFIVPDIIKLVLAVLLSSRLIKPLNNFLTKH